MPIKIRNLYDIHKTKIKFIAFILVLPFILIFLNLLMNTIFNLGIYTGTFIRILYELVTY